LIYRRVTGFSSQNPFSTAFQVIDFYRCKAGLKKEDMSVASFAETGQTPV